MVIFENKDSNGLNNGFFFFFFGNDLSMTYPQQIQLFSYTDGRLDTANVLSLENAFNFFFFISPCCVYSFTYVFDCQRVVS